MRTLIAIPVYNEAHYVTGVLERVLAQGHDVLVIDDGSTDPTPAILDTQPVFRITHPTNLGYGKSLQDAFAYANQKKYDWIITMDCDEQHEPDAIPVFIDAATEDTHDIISGSRYLKPLPEDDAPPRERRGINTIITREINERLGDRLLTSGGNLITDAFCGFKAHRVSAMQKLSLDEDGYAFPLQLWPQVAAASLRVREIPVRLIYNDPNRSFGGELDDANIRLAHYRHVFHCELLRFKAVLPAYAWADVRCPCCP